MKGLECRVVQDFQDFLHILGVGFLPYVVLSCPVPWKKEEGESSVGLFTVSCAKFPWH